MPSKINRCFYRNLTFEKMLLAHNRSRKNKIYRAEVIKFELDLETNIINLVNDIKSGKYKIRRI